MAGQPEFGSGNLVEFDVYDMEIIEGGLKSQYVIERDAPFDVQITCKFQGAWALWLVSLGLDADFRVSAESIGLGDDYDLGTETFTTAAGTLEYTVTLNVDPNPMDPGTYTVVGAITMQGAPPPPIAGYDEVPVLQII